MSGKKFTLLRKESGSSLYFASKLIKVKILTQKTPTMYHVLFKYYSLFLFIICQFETFLSWEEYEFYI